MKKIAWLLSLVIVMVSCQEKQSGKLLSIQSPLEGAEWISSPLDRPAEDSMLYTEQSTSLFKKTIYLGKKPREAVLFVTAAGYYSVFVNGKEMSDFRLDPAWTDYSKRVYYRSIDLAPYLKKGLNTLVLELAPGWYDPLPLRMWGHANLRERLSIGDPAVMAALHYQSVEGDSVLVTDATWKFMKGAIFKSSVYLGEWLNRYRLDTLWMIQDEASDPQQYARISEGPGAKPEPAFFPPVRITQRHKPVAIWKSGPDRWMLDFGTNMTGVLRFSGQTAAGDTLQFRYGERIYADSTLNPMTAVTGQIKRAGVGGPGAPAIAEQVDGVISEGAYIVFEPRFTYHAFRYVEVKGLVDQPDPEWFTALHMHTDVLRNGRLQSDQPWMDSLQQMIAQTFTSNLVSVQSDCPAREKFGYGGDLNATAESYLYFYDMKEFYRKTLFDWKDAMKDDRFVDTAPFVGIEYCGLSWESAFILVQEQLFDFYRDTILIKSWYNDNLRWMEKVARLHPDGWITTGLSDHESLKPVPAFVIQNTHLLAVYKAMQKFAQISGDQNNAGEFARKAEELRGRLADSLWHHVSVTDIANPQTWYSTVIYFDLLDPVNARMAADSLVKAINDREGALSTGIFGTQYLLEALSKSGHHDLAYELVRREDFPGWRFMLNQGATTLWETWKESDNTFSQNHPMFGSVAAWMFKWLGGIRFDADDRFGVMLAPGVVDEVKDLKVSKMINGEEIKLSWITKGDQIIFDVHLPSEMTAIWSPALPQGYSLKGARGRFGTAVQSDSGNKEILHGGKYRFIYEKKGANSSVLSIIHAGSLAVPMQRLAHAFEQHNPGVEVQLEAHGSLACVRKITDLNWHGDLVALADWELIDRFLIPDFTGKNTLFATNSMCIAYREGAHGADSINASNWFSVLSSPEVRYGRSDPDSDPCGYRTILSLKLADLYYDGGADWEALLRKDTRYIRPKEADLNALLESRNVDYIFTYKSIAVQHGFSFVELPDSINLSNPSLDDWYATVSVMVRGNQPDSLVEKKGAVTYYGISILDEAPNPALANEFLGFLLDPLNGLKIIGDSGQKTIEPKPSPASK